MAFPRLWEILFGSSGGSTILSDRLPAATDKAKGAVKTTEVVLTSEQNLDENTQTQVLDNLGVIQALTELIQENGGTVPTSLSANSVQTMGAAQSADPWSDLN